MLQFLKLKRTSIFAAIAIALTIVSIPAEMASANSWRNCTGVDFTTSYLSSAGYRYTNQFTVPSDSDCPHIWAATITGNCQYLRVRFYPSSGGSYTNGWKYSCQDTIPTTIATDVLDGTRYRVESQLTSRVSSFTGYH